MTMQRLNDFISSGTNAERLAFTPTPATPPSGPDPSCIWHETDTGNTYCWNFDSSAWIKINNAPTSTTPNAVTFNNSGSGAASGTNFDGSAAQTISYNTIGAQPSDATLTALSAVAWSAGTQVLTLTAADTFTLKTVGIAAGNILDKTAGDTLYQPVGSYQPSDATLTALAGLAWSAGTQVPVFTATDTVSFKTVGSSTGNILDKAAGDSLYQPLSTALLKANNLSDLASAPTARTNLGLGTAATQATGVFAQVANNLSDLASVSTARTNLGLLRLIAFFFTTTPTASEVLGLYVAADAFTIPANMSGSQVKVGTNATATFAIDVQQNGTSIGTISIATSGTATLTTTSGTSKSIAAGDVIKFVAPSSADATIANVAVTIKGTL